MSGLEKGLESDHTDSVALDKSQPLKPQLLSLKEAEAWIATELSMV